MKYINIATEDVISEAVGERLIEQFTSLQVNSRYRKGGNSYLRSKLKSYYEIAKRYPVLLITDLDNYSCAPALITDWEQGVNILQPQEMLFRVASREIEAWLLADYKNISALLNIKNNLQNPDTITDPKQKIVELAKNSDREIRDALVPQKGAVAKVGIGYNNILVQFIKSSWQPEIAMNNSDSLRRCILRLQELDARYIAT